MTPHFITGNSILGRDPYVPETRPQLAVLCLSGSLGGLELNSLKFAGWMQERGWRVTFIAPPATPLAQWAEEWFVPLETLPVRRGLAMPRAAWELKAQLERLQVDVLVVTQNKDLALATLVKTLMGGRLRVIYQQHMQLGRPKRGLIHTLRFRQLDAWLTPLPGLAREVARLTRFDARKLHVVPLGLPLEQFAPATRTAAQARQELGLPLNGPLLGILGRLDAGKGQDFVIEALHHLRTQCGRDASLLIMGEPTRDEGDEYLRQLQAQVKQLGLENQVHFRGFRANPAVFYQAIDVFVLASENETYGMAPAPRCRRHRRHRGAGAARPHRPALPAPRCGRLRPLRPPHPRRARRHPPALGARPARPLALLAPPPVRPHRRRD
jgi:glycosyltransferase involved in cell wall biosynthesis